MRWTGIVLVFLYLPYFFNLTVAFWVAMRFCLLCFSVLIFYGRFLCRFIAFNSFTTFGFLMALGHYCRWCVVVGESIYSVAIREVTLLRNTIKGTMPGSLYQRIGGVYYVCCLLLPRSQIEGTSGRLYSQVCSRSGHRVISCHWLNPNLIFQAHLAYLNYA